MLGRTDPAWDTNAKNKPQGRPPVAARSLGTIREPTDTFRFNRHSIRLSLWDLMELNVIAGGHRGPPLQ